MYQAGVKNITLYENKGITFSYYDSLNRNAITNLQSQGAIIYIENYQQPSLKYTVKISNSGQVVVDYEIKFLILELALETISTLDQLMRSIYGWTFLVEYYDGTFKYYRSPIRLVQSSIDQQKEMSFEVEMKSAVPSLYLYFDYQPDVSTVPIYRFDTELVSFDSEIYSFDYEL